MNTTAIKVPRPRPGDLRLLRAILDEARELKNPHWSHDHTLTVLADAQTFIDEGDWRRALDCAKKAEANQGRYGDLDHGERYHTKLKELRAKYEQLAKEETQHEPTTRSSGNVPVAGVQRGAVEKHVHEDLPPTVSEPLAPAAIADSESLVRGCSELQQDSDPAGANGAEPQHPAPTAPRPQCRRATRTAHRSNDPDLQGDTMSNAPNTALQAHIKALRRAGWTRAAIATSAGIGTATLGRAMRGQATENTCAALLGIEVRKIAKTPKPKAPPKKHPVPAAALEHAQKLRAMGWTWGAISQRINYSETGLVNIISGHRPMKPETEAALLAIPLEPPATWQGARKSQSPALTAEPKPESVAVPKPLRVTCADCDSVEGMTCYEPTCSNFRPAPKPTPRTPLEHIDAKIAEAEARRTEAELRLRILRELRAELQ